MTIRPPIDATAALSYLATLPPIARLAAAEAYGDDARALVGQLARIRQAAIVEAHAQGEPLDLSDTSIRDAVRPDEKLLIEALHCILNNEATTLRRDQVEQGVRARVPIEVRARRVKLAALHLLADRLSEDEQALITRADERARQILGPYE